MIDQWRVRRESNDMPDPGYTPDHVMTDKALFNADASSLAVVFPIWHGGGIYHQTLVERLARQGVGVLDYKLHDQIIEPNIERVLESYSHLQAAMAEDLHRLHEEYNYRRIHFTGLSLGNVALSLVAQEFPNFTSATMVTPGSNLARSLWEGIRTQSIRRELSDQGYTAEELDEAWQPLAPKNYAGLFKDKAVNIVISTRDKVIPSVYQIEMLNALKKADAQLSTRLTSKGHYWTTGMFYKFRGKI
jgi:predicted peptidase